MMRWSGGVGWLLLAVAGAGAAPVTVTIGERVGTIHRLLGVNIGPLPAGEPGNADLTAAYQRTGITQVRTHDFYGPLDMATLYPDQSADPRRPESYHFRESDRVWQAILNGGFEPYLRLGDSYHNSPGYPKADPRHPRNEDNFVQATVEVVRHYTDERRWGPTKVRYVEFWNEPDGMFWDGTPASFHRLYVKAAKALKAAFPTLQIGGPGLTPAGALAPRGQQFTSGLLRAVRQAGAPLDFLSWHMYANDVANYEKACRFYRDALDQAGLRATVMHVTEYHTSHRNQSRDDQLALRAGARGAALLTAGWMVLQRHDVREAMVYRGPDPALNAPQFYGLFYADGRPKRTALAFSLWAEFCRASQRLQATSSAELPALAARDDRGRVSLLLANLTNHEVSWHTRGLVDAVRVREVNDQSPTIVERTIPSASGTMPAWAVQLVTPVR